MATKGCVTEHRRAISRSDHCRPAGATQPRQGFALANRRILPLYDDQVLPDDPTRFNQARLDDANEQAAIRWEREAWTSEVNQRTRSVVERARRQ